jgi:hypothetical protein
MLPARSEHTISAGERTHTNVLDRSATGTVSITYIHISKIEAKLP